MTGKTEKKEMGWVDGKSRNVSQTEKSSNTSNSKFQLIDSPVEGRGKKPEGGSLSLRSARSAKKLAKTAANKIKKAAVAAAKQAMAEQAVTEKARLSSIAK